MTLPEILRAAFARHEYDGNAAGFARTGASLWQYRTLGAAFVERRRSAGRDLGWTSWELVLGFAVDEVLADDFILLGDDEIADQNPR